MPIRPPVIRIAPGFAPAVAAGLLCLMPAAWAEPSPALDRISISAGAFQADPRFNASLAGDANRVDTGDIKPGKVTMPRVTADVLIGDSHGLSFDYYHFRRGYDAQAGSGNLSADARMDLGLDFAKLGYKWWLGSGNTVLGLGAGAAYYRIDINGRAAIGAGGIASSYRGSGTEDAFAPMLEVGVRHAINPDLRLFADASGVWKDGGELHGSIYNAALGVEWFPVKNLGVVLSYGLTDIDLTREGSADARLKVRLQGPSAFVKLRF